VSEPDIANFAIAGELTLSIVVAQLALEDGSAEEVDDGQFVDIPARHYRFTGTLDLCANDAWHVMMAGTRGVSAFRAEPGTYRCLWVLPDEAEQFDVSRERLVVRHAERQRFEAEQAAAETVAGAPPLVVQKSGRGAPTKYDWDEFSCELVVTTQIDGFPESQAALVRRMLQWFAARNQYPDHSTIKKKVALLWRRYHEALARLTMSMFHLSPSRVNFRGVDVSWSLARRAATGSDRRRSRPAFSRA